MFLKLDWGIIWPIVNIIVFYLLLRKFLFGPVSAMMEKRKEVIAGDLKEAAADKQQAANLKAEYEDALSKAKEEAGDIIADARDQAKSEYQAKVKEAGQEIVQMKENARKDMEAQKRSAMAKLQTEIAGIALMAASKVVEKETDKESNEKLLDDFLKEAGV